MHSWRERYTPPPRPWRWSQSSSHGPRRRCALLLAKGKEVKDSTARSQGHEYQQDLVQQHRAVLRSILLFLTYHLKHGTLLLLSGVPEQRVSTLQFVRTACSGFGG